MNARNHPQPTLEAIDGGFVADASKVSPRQFLDALGLVSNREQRRAEDRAACKRAIARGDTYGWPPMLVDQCKAEMQAEEDALVLAPVTRISPNGVAA